jgi:hypothetical protein
MFPVVFDVEQTETTQAGLYLWMLLDVFTPRGGTMWQFSPDYRAFCVSRDAWLMLEGLNDVDPFVVHPPCYEQSPFVAEVVTLRA